ncbi:MAG: glutamate racemase, partial [Candidatus Omnitrophota bacterium]
DRVVKVLSQACPLFVPLVEEDWVNEKSTFDIAKKYLSSFKKEKIDTLILGCTHYPLLKPVIRKVMGQKIRLIDSAKQLAKEIKEILICEEMLSKNKRKGRFICYVSDEPSSFKKLARRFLGYDLKNVQRIANV